MILLLMLLTHPVLDSVLAQYNTRRPDSLNMIAKCTLVPDRKFRVLFVKGRGLEIRSMRTKEQEEAPDEATTREIIRATLFLTGLGLSEAWNDLGGESLLDTLTIKDNWIMAVSKFPFLFTRAKLKVENSLITEAKIKAQGQDISAEVKYESGLPVKITAETSTSQFSAKYEYEQGHGLRVPLKTEIVNNSPDIPEEWNHITITYSIAK